MQEKRLLLNFEQHISPKENSYFNQGVLDENSLKDTSPNRSLWHKTDRNTVQEVEIINVLDPDVASLLKKRVMMERCTTPNQITTRSAKKSSDGSNSRQRTKPAQQSLLEPWIS